MVSFSRTLKNSSSQTNNHRASLTSTITTQSIKVGNHNSFISTTFKRVVSAIEHRASWNTTTSATVSIDENTPLTRASPTTMSEADSMSTPDSSKRNRHYGPKIQAMLNKFESKSPDGQKENREVKEWSPVTPGPNNAKPTKDHEIVEIVPVISASTNSSLLKERATNEGAMDYVAPLFTKPASTVRKLRSMTSKIDLVKRERSIKEKKRPKTDLIDISSGFADSWNEKFEALADWADQCFTNGRMPDFDLEVMHKANDLPTTTSLSSHDTLVESMSTVLTPEQDLMECFSRGSCHPHQTAYFARLLRDAKKKTVDRPLANQSHIANEVALTLIYHPCRIPLVFRIEAVHLLLKNGWTADVEKLLNMAWKWCHQLHETGVLISLMHETHKLWAIEFSGLDDLPTIERQPPTIGYAVKDRTRCL